MSRLSGFTAKFWTLTSCATPEGAFGWYAGWCLIGWVLVLCFLPEVSSSPRRPNHRRTARSLTPASSQTKALSLEELDQVFSVPTHHHATYQLRQVPYWFGKNILRKNVS